MIVVDNTFLTLMLHPLAKPPLDPSTNLPVSRLGERIELLIETLDDAREQIIIPAPVLSEFLILAGDDGPKYLTEIDKRSIFRVAAFDTKAAIELAAIELGIKKSKGRRAYKGDGVGGTWAKVKFDRQLVVIARVNGASKIYSDDNGVANFAEHCGIGVVKTWELPLPQGTQESFWTAMGELENIAPSPAGLLTGQIAESDNNHEEAATGTGEAAEPATAGVSAISRPSEASGVSTEAGSGAGEGEAGEG